MKKLIIQAALFLLTISPLSSYAQLKQVSQQAEITEKITELFPQLGEVTIEESPVAGVYQFWVGATLNHARLQDGFLLLGELYDTKRRVSLSSEAKKGKVREIVESLELEMIIYPAKKQKRVINVFTDVDCHFCRKLHSELGALNDAGITVRYIAFPAFSRDIPKHVSVWCADVPQQAMTLAKAGKSIEQKTCDATVEKTLQLGFDLGFRGTPQIVYDTGQIIGGYRPAEQIINDFNLGG